MKGIYYTLLRVIIVLYIAMISIFALDAESFLGFLIHLIPSILLVGIAAIAWRSDKAGGILFIVLAFIFTAFFNTYNNWGAFVFVSLPLFAIGILFLINTFKFQKRIKRVAKRKIKKRR